MMKEINKIFVSTELLFFVKQRLKCLSIVIQMFRQQILHHLPILYPQVHVQQLCVNYTHDLRHQYHASTLLLVTNFLCERLEIVNDILSFWNFLGRIFMHKIAVHAIDRFLSW